MSDNNKAEYILGNKITPLQYSFDKTEEYKSVTDRYFTKRYCIDIGMDYGDYCILLHSNRICIVTLAPTHPLLSKKDLKITKLDFQVTNKIDRLNNRMSGKAKRGAQIIQHQHAVLFFAECSDGIKYKICSGAIGKLIEINEAVINDPDIMITYPNDKGYVAIILPNINNYEKFKNDYITEEQYNEKRFQNKDFKGNVANEDGDDNDNE